MIAVYITSTQNFSGKSALCVGLIKSFLKKGIRTGYFKPISTSAKYYNGRLVDEDTMFIMDNFSLKDPLEAVCPVLLSDRVVEELVKDPEIDYKSKIIQYFKTLSSDKDIMVIEGASNQREGWLINFSPLHMVKELNTKVLAIVPYENNLQFLDDVLTLKGKFEERLLGVVLNKIPKIKMGVVENLFKPYIENKGIKVFAVFPKETILLSTSVAEILEGLGGELLCASDHVNDLVEHLMIGAMSVDSALRYFRRYANKAVITGGDRPDIQLAALETSTRCLILTGNIRPNPMIVAKAEDMGVPIILTQHDTLTTVEIIESFFGKTRFHQKKKIMAYEEMMLDRFDFHGLYDALGL